MLEKTFKEKTFTLEILYHIGALEDSIHFIFDHDSKTCAIIDPAWDPQLFVKRIEDKGYTLTDIWLTHWHFDHTNAVDELVEMTGAKVTAGIYESLIYKLKLCRIRLKMGKLFLLEKQRPKLSTPLGIVLAVFAFY